MIPVSVENPVGEVVTFNTTDPSVQVAVFENGEVTQVTLPDDGFVVVTGPRLVESGRQEFPTTGTVQITFKPVPPPA